MLRPKLQGRAAGRSALAPSLPSIGGLAKALPRRTLPVPARDANGSQPAKPSVHAKATATEVKTKTELQIVKVDPAMKDHQDHINYRWEQYKETKQAIVKAEGGLAQFAQGYKKLGVTRVGKATVYREWAPAAQAAALIGDFSGWKEVWMTKDQWGIWEVILPDGADGKPAIPHKSRIKIKLQAPGGWWVDRLPAWIKWATVEPNKMGAKYDGVFWNPPESEQYKWKHSRPAKPRSLRIYEAHVGMSSEDRKVASYTHFKDVVLPRIKRNGYTAIQLMAVQEHAYYGSFGYHVTNPFAVSSRSGTPDELKALIDEAHRLGIVVLLDVVHSHISSNADDGLAGFDLGQGEDCNYFHTGDKGYHKLWDSKCLNYKNWEVLRYLLSNVRWWMEEYRFDGFRFDGVTSMLYWDHGINRGFSGHYHEYFGLNTNVDACVYLMLANELAHELHKDAIVIAEDVSGMPGLCRPVSEGGLGFDYRLGMAIPDKWIELLKERRDEHWGMMEIVKALCNRRYTEKTVGYAESHDQALVGDKTIAFRLMDQEMYDGMSTLKPASPVIERGIAMHKVIRAVTMALGGEAWLTFMGNEFGHPEWIDFPREGNNWSHWYCRRQWSLAEQDHLRYHHLGGFDRALMELDDRFQFLASPHQWVTHIDEKEQVLVAERGPLVWVFNFSPHKTYEGYRVAAREGGKWRVALDSDAYHFGGKGRVSWDADHFTVPGKFHDRDQSMMVMAPSRSVVAYYRTEDFPAQAAAQDREREARDRAWREAQEKANKDKHTDSQQFDPRKGGKAVPKRK